MSGDSHGACRCREVAEQLNESPRFCTSGDFRLQKKIRGTGHLDAGEILYVLGVPCLSAWEISASHARKGQRKGFCLFFLVLLPLPYSVLITSHVGYPWPALVPQRRKDLDRLQLAQQRAPELIRAGDHPVRRPSHARVLTASLRAYKVSRALHTCT